MAFFTWQLALTNMELVNSTNQIVKDNRELVNSTRQLVQANKKLVDYTRQTNERAEKLFVGQNKPLIDVTPTNVIQVSKTHTKTTFSVVNYSGFTAYDIGIDVQYGDNNAGIWKWVEANENEKNGKIGIVLNEPYPLTPKVLRHLEVLKSGETKYKDIDGNYLIAPSGSLDLEKKVCSEGSKGYPVFVRVTWKNKKGHTFDEIHKYKLICTKNTNDPKPALGRALAFIPEGIISQKDMPILTNTITVYPDDCNSLK